MEDPYQNLSRFIALSDSQSFLSSLQMIPESYLKDPQFNSKAYIVLFLSLQIDLDLTSYNAFISETVQIVIIK